MIANMTMYAVIPVKNLKQAMDFYGNTLGLNIIDENPNGIWYESGQSRIAIYQSKHGGTNKGTCAIFEVIDPEGIVEALQSKGVVFKKYNLPGVKRKGVIHTMGNFKAAWFSDPSGNIIAIGTHL